jgi:hypothetical protein
MRPLNRAHALTLTGAHDCRLASPQHARVVAERQLQRAGNDVPYLLVGMLVRVDVRIRRDAEVGKRHVVGVKEPPLQPGRGSCEGRLRGSTNGTPAIEPRPAPELTRSATGAWGSPRPDHRQERAVRVLLLDEGNCLADADQTDALDERQPSAVTLPSLLQDRAKQQRAGGPHTRRRDAQLQASCSDSRSQALRGGAALTVPSAT